MSSRDERVELLKGVPLFARCSPEQLEAIAAVAAEFSLSSGRELMVEGEAGGQLVVVLEGEVAVERDGETIAAGRAGDFFGEIALLTDRRRSATVRAASDVRVLVVDGFRFEQLMREAPALAVTVTKAVAERLEADEA